MQDKMTKEGDSEIEQDQSLSDCSHHWVIESPNGPTSQGTCKLCGEHSEFKNSIPGTGWDRGNSQARRGKQSRT